MFGASTHSAAFSTVQNQQIHHQSITPSVSSGSGGSTVFVIQKLSIHASRSLAETVQTVLTLVPTFEAALKNFNFIPVTLLHLSNYMSD